MAAIISDALNDIVDQTGEGVEAGAGEMAQAWAQGALDYDAEGSE